MNNFKLFSKVGLDETSRYYLSQIKVNSKFYITSQMIVADWLLKILLPKEVEDCILFSNQKNILNVRNKMKKNYFFQIFFDFSREMY